HFGDRGAPGACAGSGGRAGNVAPRRRYVPGHDPNRRTQPSPSPSRISLVLSRTMFENRVSSSPPRGYYLHGARSRIPDRVRPAEPPAGPDEPRRLEGLRRTLRPEDHRLVSPVAPPGGGRAGRDPKRPGQAGPAVAQVHLRPAQGHVPRLAENA